MEENEKIKIVVGNMAENFRQQTKAISKISEALKNTSMKETIKYNSTVRKVGKARKKRKKTYGKDKKENELFQKN